MLYILCSYLPSISEVDSSSLIFLYNLSLELSYLPSISEVDASSLIFLHNFSLERAKQSSLLYSRQTPRSYKHQDKYRIYHHTIKDTTVFLSRLLMCYGVPGRYKYPDLYRICNDFTQGFYLFFVNLLNCTIYSLVTDSLTVVCDSIHTIYHHVAGGTRESHQFSKLCNSWKGCQTFDVRMGFSCPSQEVAIDYFSPTICINKHKHDKTRGPGALYRAQEYHCNLVLFFF